MQDKDAWKKNTIAQLKETRDRMQKLSENQLETLTKRTILENEAMAAELKYQSRQVRLQPACMSLKSNRNQFTNEYSVTFCWSILSPSVCYTALEAERKPTCLSVHCRIVRLQGLALA